MTNFQTGHDAEKTAAEYLQKKGYKIIDINWKTKYCEIDIIAQKDKSIYFVEVKYRNNDSYGSGLDYITPKKLKQMTFAAEMWIQQNNTKFNYQLAALELSSNPNSINFICDL